MEEVRRERLPLEAFVLIKQVPDPNSKTGINSDGTIDRTRAKRMLNPFDRYALEAALQTKRQHGARVTAITMGPPPAIEVLYEAIAHGVDRGILITDRRLAASDTLATAYTLAQTVRYAGQPDILFCGLQTTDGDTAQVGPQLAERLGIPQVTYCEAFEIQEGILVARRAIEGGSQTVRVPLPVLVTVANTARRLAYPTLRGMRRVQQLLRDEAARAEVIQILSLDDVGADPERCGLKGSPTIVAATEKVGEMGGNCQVFQGQPVPQLVQQLTQAVDLFRYTLTS
ncbi:electron transfer flavoprotein subunit beta/FixA family protein [Synechococcus sp. H65.1]|uniref:electron transfer flavoprotein subunit beta/FixA family protein n=1 Tax=unclassified Synechococcus TaxID=2626047 RepID=UPI0039C0E307